MLCEAFSLRCVLDFVYVTYSLWSYRLCVFDLQGAGSQWPASGRPAGVGRPSEQTTRGGTAHLRWGNLTTWCPPCMLTHQGLSCNWPSQIQIQLRWWLWLLPGSDTAGRMTDDVKDVVCHHVGCVRPWGQPVPIRRGRAQGRPQPRVPTRAWPTSAQWGPQGPAGPQGPTRARPTRAQGGSQGTGPLGPMAGGYYMCTQWLECGSGNTSCFWG